LDYLTTNTSLSPIRRGFAPGFVNNKKGCTRLAVASDKVYQLLAHGRWFSLGTPASSTTKTGCHDIAEILLKVALRHNKTNKSKSSYFIYGENSKMWEFRNNTRMWKRLFPVYNHNKISYDPLGESKKNIDIKFSAHDAFLEKPSSGTLKTKDWKAK